MSSDSSNLFAASSVAADGARQARELIDFDPEPYRRELVAIIRAIESLEVPAGGVLSSAAVQPILRLNPRDGRGFFSRSQIIAGFRSFAPSEAFALPEERFAQRLQRRPVRSRSGVTPVTVLTRPFPCPGRCIFCPNDVRMPKSYLADEPGAQRAAANRFDPYLQVWNRLAAYRAIGHPTDKIEVIVLGGTWSFYPEPYRVWFAMRLFDALNDFGQARDGRPEARASAPETNADAPLRPIDGRREASGAYNRAISGNLQIEGAAGEGAPWDALEQSQRRNETARCRAVGLVLETRPDHVTPSEILALRRLGATKVQIGIQSLTDRVLQQNKRGHDVAATRTALRLLRGAGFKLHAHWMPNLLGATPESDRAEFAQLFDDPAFRPDELKVYPCSLVESAELMRYYESGEWRPYGHQELLEVVVAVLEHAPRYARLTRVVRDISSDDIVAGNQLTNFREIAERELTRRGGEGVDIRAREIRGDCVDVDSLVLRSTDYPSSLGQECFLEFVTPDDRIAAFLRLSLPREGAGRELHDVLPELRGSALIREVHVYGSALGIGEPASHQAQHRGLGRRLVEASAQRARAAGYRDLAVISAVGTRGYYKRLGFDQGALYQHLALDPSGSAR